MAYWQTPASSYIADPATVEGIGSLWRFVHFTPLTRNPAVVAATEIEQSNTAPRVPLGTTPSTYASFQEVVGHQREPIEDLQPPAPRVPSPVNVKAFDGGALESLKKQAQAKEVVQGAPDNQVADVSPKVSKKVRAAKRPSIGDSAYRSKKLARSTFDLV